MDGVLPLFPLTTVLFPGVALPLRVFEDRYRAMMRDLLAGPEGVDRELGIVAIKVGFEVGSHGQHTVQRTGCSAVLTEIDAHGDGTYDVVVVGRRRFRVASLTQTEPYLRAEVDWLPEGTSPAAPAAVARAVTVFDRYRRALRRIRGEDVLEGATPTDPLDLSYTMAASVVTDQSHRQSLLEAPDTAARLAAVTRLVERELTAIGIVPSLPATQPAVTGWHPN